MVQPWVRKLVEDVYGVTAMRVGAQLRHPDGRLVQITRGQYWGSRGVSNFWHWREVNTDGTLSKTEECGYGWC